MTSDTRNVKLGVCRVLYDGADLGYTKGGVEVMVTTETHKTEVDQFGKTAISETIMGRDVKVKVPMAETTLRNLAKVMPGASLVETGGAAATGTWTPTGNPTNSQTVVINGKTVTFKTSGAIAANLEVNLGATVALTLTALAAMLNASQDTAIAQAQYSASPTVLTATFNDKGVAGNAFTLAVGTSTGTVSGATLSGGTDPTAIRVDVTNGVGVNLLDIAKPLILHPQNLPDSNKSEDFIVPLAATAGALTFAYKLDEERVFPVEFTGYPDPTTRLMFQFGDVAAVAS